MAEEALRGKLVWLLVAINLISGVLWVFASFGVVREQEGINLLYLAVGLVSLVAGGVWLLNAMASRQR